MTMLAGADMISGVGGLSGGLTASASQVVVDNEIIGYLRRGLSGVKVDDLHLSVDMMQDLGTDGTFLTHPKTGEILRRERWFPELSIHDTYEIWKAAGSQEFDEKADTLAAEIIDGHESEPLDPKLQKTLNEVVRKAQERLT
jgi:trimethylamine--corrinoid protein Co-methyltransferase